MWPWKWCRRSKSTKHQNTLTSALHEDISTPTTPPNTKIPSLLELLPVELIYRISSSLPLYSASSLALCSKILYDILGSKTLQSLNANESERAKFLQLLDRDLPETLFCHFCARLHVLFPEYRAKKGIGTEERFRRVADGRCQSADGEYNYGVAFTYFAEFNFEHVQIAAKLRRYSDDPIEANAYMERLSIAGQPAIGRMTQIPHLNGPYFFVPRYIDNQIYVRAKNWYWATGATKEKLNDYTQFYSKICAHLDDEDGILWKTSAYREEFRRSLEFFFDGTRNDCPEACAGLIRCKFCPTEVTVQAKRSPTDKVDGGFLIATKWQNIGYAISPAEPEWKNPLDRKTRVLWPYAPGDLPGKIRDKFERSVEIKYDSLIQVSEAKRILIKAFPEESHWIKNVDLQGHL